MADIYVGLRAHDIVYPPVRLQVKLPGIGTVVGYYEPSIYTYVIAARDRYMAELVGGLHTFIEEIIDTFSEQTNTNIVSGIIEYHDHDNGDHFKFVPDSGAIRVYRGEFKWVSL